MAAPRASSFLPTIKCSNCSREIEISMMGDHICGGASEPTPPPDSQGVFPSSQENPPASVYKQTPTNGAAFLKPGRAIPPRVDTSAANRPFLRPTDQLTPTSAYSDYRSPSPMTPSSGRSRSPSGRPPTRSATAPPPRQPAVMMSSGIDSPFPPFGATIRNPSTPKMSPAAFGGNRSHSSHGHRNTQQNQHHNHHNHHNVHEKVASPEPIRPPPSQNNATEGSLMSKMNTIAPGPFGVTVDEDKDNEQSGKGHKRTATAGSVKSLINKPALSEEKKHTKTTSVSSITSNGKPRPRPEGYEGFGAPEKTEEEPQGSEWPRVLENRAETFPKRADSANSSASSRRPSEPGSGPNELRVPSAAGNHETSAVSAPFSSSPPKQRMSHKKRPSRTPDLSRPLPPRGVSLIGARNGGTRGDVVPEVPNFNMASEFGIGNPYHTPSDSQSSNGSGYSEHSRTSSRSSPPVSGHPRRTKSNTSSIDNLMADIQSSMAELQPREIPTKAAPTLTPPEPQFATSLPAKPFMMPESPMDPAIQAGRLSPKDALETEPIPPPLMRANTAPANPDKPPKRRGTASKGNCKACTKPITGKSVSSADGRLTGRYHKACFVCKTCSEPFSTSMFYVHNDSPYCERHYHKANGSVCKFCDKGIEGEYLATEDGRKFHKGCLKCTDCSRVLKSDYFEMGGRVYCERDAFSRAQNNRGGLRVGGQERMERRTTRLMMMG